MFQTVLLLQLQCTTVCAVPRSVQHSHVCEQSSSLVVRAQWALGVESPFVLHDCISLSQC